MFQKFIVGKNQHVINQIKFMLNTFKYQNNLKVHRFNILLSDTIHFNKVATLLISHLKQNLTFRLKSLCLNHVLNCLLYLSYNAQYKK